MKKNRFLERYHSKKTYIVVKFLVNLSIIVGFVWLLSPYYNDGKVKEWGFYIIFTALFIVFWFFYKKILEKYILKKCYGNDVNIIIKSFIHALFLVSLIFLLNGFYKIEKGHEIGDIGLFFTALFIVVWISFDKIVDSLFLSSFKIDENMDSLPTSIEGKKTLVQYDLSKEISPSEVGFLLYREADISNILCIIYKRVNEKIVKVYSKNGKKYVKVIGKLDDHVPYYEKFLYEDILENKRGIGQLDKYRLKQYVIDVNELILEECEFNGYCKYKKNSKFKNIIKLVAVSLYYLLPFIAHFIIKDFMLFIFLFLWICFLLIIPRFFYKKYTFTLTDKGKKILSKIYGYKYFLEHCEEEQINTDLEEGAAYSKHLPYAIALKLNRKIIDKLS